MRLLDHLRTCARAHRLANHRLHAAPLRAADLRALGWSERDLFGAGAPSP